MNNTVGNGNIRTFIGVVLVIAGAVSLDMTLTAIPYVLLSLGAAMISWGWAAAHIHDHINSRT
jgi:uncharacterized membrane protein HdeD (DUF308 family)